MIKEQKYIWSSYDEWFSVYQKNDGDDRGFAYPIVQAAWQAAREEVELDASEDHLIEFTMNTIDDPKWTPLDELESVLSIARLQYPSQRLALQIACGPLDSFGDSIPPWFGSHNRRCDHPLQCTDRAE